MVWFPEFEETFIAEHCIASGAILGEARWEVHEPGYGRVLQQPEASPFFCGPGRGFRTWMLKGMCTERLRGFSCFGRLIDGNDAENCPLDGPKVCGCLRSDGRRL